MCYLVFLGGMDSIHAIQYVMYVCVYVYVKLTLMVFSHVRVAFFLLQSVPSSTSSTLSMALVLNRGARAHMLEAVLYIFTITLYHVFSYMSSVFFFVLNSYARLSFETIMYLTLRNHHVLSSSFLAFSIEIFSCSFSAPHHNSFVMLCYHACGTFFFKKCKYVLYNIIII